VERSVIAATVHFLKTDQAYNNGGYEDGGRTVGEPMESHCVPCLGKLGPDGAEFEGEEQRP
jgi:hypothetical protein